MLLSRDTLDEASEARSSPRKMTRSPLVTAAARLWATLFYGHVHRPEDRDAVVKGDTLLARAYRASPWAYALLGSTMWALCGLVYANGTPATRGMVLGVALVVESAVSYLSDVRAFGDASSPWHATDRVFASVLMLACGPILALRLAMGAVVIPPTLRNAWALAVTLGLACKALSGRASRKGRLDAYLLWHTLWHFLPVLSSAFLVGVGDGRGGGGGPSGPASVPISAPIGRPSGAIKTGFP